MLLRFQRRMREARMIARAFKFPRQPILAHITPIRRCNLSCTYCNEFDNFSAPVPTSEMLRRIDMLAALGTGCITLSGGEPLMHPEADAIIARIRSHNVIAGILTNGYLLSRKRIQQLNQAGLDHMQISIDNVEPDDVSKKSLRVLDRKLHLLSKLAKFDVNINSVLGSGVAHPEDAIIIARRALSLGFSSTVGLIHDGAGQMVPLDYRQQEIYKQLERMSRNVFSFPGWKRHQRNHIEGKPHAWHCRAGSRYLYICEDGLVHYCSQMRGHPAIPLEKYGAEDLEREFHTVKTCAPFCTISCVHRTSMLSDLREKPLETLGRWLSPEEQPISPEQLPFPVRLLTWLFVTSKTRRLFRRSAERILRL